MYSFTYRKYNIDELGKTYYLMLFESNYLNKYKNIFLKKFLDLGYYFYL